MENPIKGIERSQLQLLQELRKQQDELRQQLAEELRKQIEAEQNKGVQIPEQLRATMMTILMNAVLNTLSKITGTGIPTTQPLNVLKSVKIE